MVMDKKSKMFAMVAQWRESGLTRTVFAHQCGIGVASFDYWCKKQYNEVVKLGDRPTPMFLELNSKEVSPAKKVSPQIELSLPSGLLIRIY